MRFRSLLGSLQYRFISFGRSGPPQSQRNGASRSCQCSASVEPRQSSSHPQSRFGCWCRPRRSDRLFLLGGDVSEVRRILASHVLHDRMRDLVLQCLAINTDDLDCGRRCNFEPFPSSTHRRAETGLLLLAVGPLFAHPLWVRSFLTRCGSVLFSVLLHSGARWG